MLFLSASATAATVQVQPDGTINSITGMFISANHYVDVEFGAVLAPGEGSCMLGPACPAGTYVIALNAFLNGDDYDLVNSVSGIGAGVYTVKTPVTRLQYMYDGSGWIFSQSGMLEADSDIRFTVSNVPIPAAVWLFVSALGGFGLLKRKQTI